ncbi:RNA dependent RNA polymerase-domain-containing protein [Phellopilus nigrolimitatus]|nr:RNA dependent RNA polymerase-domain-containing protein [Phellopilus nigrolimitatus]
MPPRYADDVFSNGLQRADGRYSDANACSGSGIISKKRVDDIFTSPSVTPTKATPRTTNVRSPKKANRIMAEKSVDTAELHEEKNRKNSEFPAKAPRRELQHPPEVKAPRTFIASSQKSFWEGESDEEIDELISQWEEHEVEDMMDTQPTDKQISPNLGSGSSGSSFSSVETVSTDKTSVDSDVSRVAVAESPRRRKRCESPGSECHRPRLMPANSPQIGDECRRTGPGSSKSFQKLRVDTVGPAATPRPGFLRQKHIVESPTVITAISSHARESKQLRPIPRNPGRGAAVTNTSAVTANGIVHSSTPKANVAPSTSSASSSQLPVNPQPVKIHEVDLNRHRFLIAHDKRAQALMDKYRIAKGVQFEIARGVTQQWWDWDDVTEGKIKALTGSNLEKAGEVANVIGSKGPRSAASAAVVASRRAIYAELDREHLAFVEGKGRGLGLMGPWCGEDNWHGGRVQLNARLRVKEDKIKGGQPYFITLENFGHGKSNRVTRYMTSLSILQLKIGEDAKKALQDGLIDFLAQRFVLCGRQFVPFHPKEDKVYCVEINEDLERISVEALGDNFRLSFDTFIRWHNSLELNASQPISKWATRWALSLSTSKPVLEFAAENIYLDFPDVYAEGQNRTTDTMMTDGCGFINQSALAEMARLMNTYCSTAVQGRIAGAKGLWLLHPDLQHRSLDEPPKIWVRDSQLKVKHVPTAQWERSHRIFDLVRIQRLTVPSSLYMQTIQNMSYNGVKDEVFVDLLEVGLKKEIDALTSWDGPNARTRLAKAVEDAGGVTGSRLSRLSGHDARMFGFIRDEKFGAIVDDDEEEKGLIERDFNSGQPISLYELVREMLQAGFTPLRNHFLREELKQIVKNVTNAYLEQYHIPIERSAEAFIVPDPHGVLAEGEIFFRSATKDVGDPTTSPDPRTFLGPVLVTRNPTGVASDVRKVTAVHHDKLLSYKDVIVFSTKGPRSPASYLGGGDYDGDTVTIIAEPKIVDAFENSRIVDPPSDLRSGFEREIEEVSAFISRVADLPALLKERELLKKLLSGLSDSKVGLYSKFHDNAAYSLGYDSPEAIRLAYMFTTCLDASKTGLRVKADVFRADSRKWNKERPLCMQTSEERKKNMNKDTYTVPIERPKDFGKFVLDALRTKGEELQNTAIREYEEMCDNADQRKDADLAAPFNSALKWAKTLKDERGVTSPMDNLDRIKAFVEGLCELYRTKLGQHFASSPVKGATYKRKVTYERAASSNGSLESSAAKLRALKRDITSEFVDGPDELPYLLPETVDQLKASYAYIYGFEKGGKLGPQFAFNVAHDTLCAIKAKKEGRVSFTREAADYAISSGNLLKASALLKATARHDD